MELRGTALLRSLGLFGLSGIGIVVGHGVALNAQSTVPYAHDSLSTQPDSLRTLSDTLILLDGPRVDQSTQLKPKEHRTRGRFEVGGIYGAVPFAQVESGPLNGYVRGVLGTDVLGIPLTMHMDLGSELPIRGQRNTIRIAYDPLRAAESGRWKTAHELNGVQMEQDALEEAKAQAQRRTAGTEARLRFLLQDLRETAGVGDRLSTLTLPQPASVETPLPTVEVPANGVDMPVGAEYISHGTLAHRDARIDSLVHLLERQRQHLAQVEAATQVALQARQRLGAMSQYGAQKAPLVDRVVQGLRRFEVGSCTPENGVYLLNGVNLQGASMTYAHKDLFVALDYGRILDDAFLDANPTATRLRELQQSLFFTDVRDLDPRRITAMKMGYGMPESDHVHVGFLRGTRADHPLGLTTTGEPNERLVNHVAEIDLGFVPFKGQLVRLTYARSVVGRQQSGNDGSNSSAEVMDLFDREQPVADALKVSWDIDLPKSGTRIGVSGQTIAPWFQSYGLGFLRTGSRIVETRFDQRLGARVRIRARSAVEERTAVGESFDRMLLIKRGQVAVQFKPTRTISLHANYIPVIAEWREGSGPSNFNQAFTGSMTIRERWRSTVVSGQAGVSYLTWTILDGTSSAVATPTVSGQMLLDDRWTLNLSWAGMLPTRTDTVAAFNNYGIQGTWRGGNDWYLEAGAQIAQGERPAWLMEMRKDLRHDMTLGARSQRYARFPVFQGGEALEPVGTDHAFTLFLRYQW